MRASKKSAIFVYALAAILYVYIMILKCGYCPIDSDYSKFLKTIKNRSINDFNVSLNESDQILTLSTCSKGGTYRIVLHAKLVK